jgi:hypothetical protein
LQPHRVTHRFPVPHPCRHALRWPRRLLPALALWALAATLPAFASVVRVLPLPELVRRSQVVAVADVESSVSSWVDERIVTDSVLVVESPLLGAAGGERLTVRTLGGEVDGLGQRVFGEPWLRRGERYLLFLEPFPSSEPTALLRPVGMAQGALPVVASPEGTFVTPNADLSALLEPCVEASLAPWLDTPRPLADVLADVRDAVREAQEDRDLP